MLYFLIPVAIIFYGAGVYSERRLQKERIERAVKEELQRLEDEHRIQCWKDWIWNMERPDLDPRHH